MNLSKFKNRFSSVENVVVMGNGPSLNQYEWDEIKKRHPSLVFLACNRISNLFLEKKLKWRPDIYTCFTSISTESDEWRKSIDACLKVDETFSFVFKKYQSFSEIEKFHDNVYFCENVLEHPRQKKIVKDFLNIELETGLVKSYSATCTLFQICKFLNVKNIYLIGQDGYIKKLGENHFSKTYKFEPKDFNKTNDRILRVHQEVKRFFGDLGVNIYNSSNQSVLSRLYEFRSLDEL